MLSSREVTAFCLAAATAPVVAALVLGKPSPWPLVAAVAYVAAFALGAPLFAYLRCRACPLAARCLLAGTIAGVVSSLALVTAVLLAFSMSRFIDNFGTVATFLAVGAAWGLGLGLLVGIVLFALLRADRTGPQKGGRAIA
jgi:hypothetical protein